MDIYKVEILLFISKTPINPPTIQTVLLHCSINIISIKRDGTPPLCISIKVEDVKIMMSKSK